MNWFGMMAEVKDGLCYLENGAIIDLMQEREAIQSKLAPIVQEYGIQKIDQALEFCRNEKE